MKHFSESKIEVDMINTSLLILILRKTGRYIGLSAYYVYGLEKY